MNMKRWTALFLTLVCILGLAGCDNRTRNYIIENEPSITGTLEEVRDNAIIIYINTQGYPNGASCKVSLDVENKDRSTAGRQCSNTSHGILPAVSTVI